MVREIESKVIELAREFHGVLFYEQLLSVGATEYLIERNVGSGAWRRAARGVYLISSSWSIEALQRAALLSAGAAASLSHKSAAIKWGLAVPPCPMVQIVIPAGAKRLAMPGVEVFRSRSWNPSEAVTRKGFRVTRLGRTISALATELSRDQMRVCLDSAARKGIEWVKVITSSLPAIAKGHEGIVMLRELLSSYGPAEKVADSVLESVALGIIEEARMGVAQRHWWEHDTRFCAELDYAWPDEMVNLELDGYAFHCTAEQLRRDKARDRTLQWMGWRVLRFTWDDVTKNRQMVIDELRLHLAQRRAEPPRFTSEAARSLAG